MRPKTSGLVLAILFLLFSLMSAEAKSRPLVGHVMALLAVFEDAGVLPPESSPDANALIHALIQTQAALTKSKNPAVRDWLTEAFRSAEQSGLTPIAPRALTSQTLEAILRHAATHPLSARPAVLAGLDAFHVGQEDFNLMGRVYWEAKDRLQQRDQDIHRIYEQQRAIMPFQ